MQVPAHFEYARASSVDDALTLLSRYGPESRVVAGGHSLIPMMKLRLAQPEALIDINDLTELAYIRIDDGRLCIGALARHADLLACAVAGQHYPILHDAERVIADPVVRNRGTIGGSLCQADPSEDLSAVFAAVRAEMVVRGPYGTRIVPAREFHTGPYETVVAPGELLLEIRVPLRPSGSSAYAKIDRRAGDWAIAAAGVALWVSDGVVAEVGIGLTAVGAAGFVAREAEDHLRGRPATEEHFAAAGRIAGECCNPPVDQRGPADYKRHLAGELTRRALHAAAARAAAARAAGAQAAGA